MILERYREHTVNMGPGTYESMKVGASVKLDTDNLPDDVKASVLDDSLDELYKAAEKILDDALASELKEVAELSLLSNSHIRSWKVQ